MKENILLRIATLLSVILTSIHITYDVLYGFEKAGTPILISLPIMAIWAYAALAPTEHKWRYIVVILFSLLGLAVPIVHMKGPGISKDIIDSPGGFYFLWTTITLGVTSTLSIILSISGLLIKRKVS